MQLRFERFATRLAALSFVCLVGGALALPADAESKTKSKQARGTFMGFDAEKATVTVKEGGRQIVYNVTPEGTVLTRTTVKINGSVSRVKDLPSGAPVIIYWRPDEENKEQRYARMIDEQRVPPELLEEFQNQ